MIMIVYEVNIGFLDNYDVMFDCIMLLQAALMRGVNIAIKLLLNHDTGRQGNFHPPFHTW